MELRIREVDKGGGLTGTHASEAKGPFSRREEGWELGEEKETKRNKKITLHYAWAKRIPRPLVSSSESSVRENPASVAMRTYSLPSSGISASIIWALTILQDSGHWPADLFSM